MSVQSAGIDQEENIRNLVKVLENLTKQHLLKEGFSLRSDEDLENATDDIIYFARKRLRSDNNLFTYCTVRKCYNISKEDSNQKTNFVCDKHKNLGFVTQVIDNDSIIVWEKSKLVEKYDIKEHFAKGSNE